VQGVKARLEGVHKYIERTLDLVPRAWTILERGPQWVEIEHKAKTTHRNILDIKIVTRGARAKRVRELYTFFPLYIVFTGIGD